MRYRSKCVAVIASICVSVVAIVSSSTAQTAKAPSAVTYNYAPKPLKVHQTLTVSVPNTFMQNSAVLLANYFHEFAKENLTVKTVVIPNPGSLPPLATGGLDIAIESWGPSVYNAIASGQKLAVIGNPFSGLPGLGFYVQSKYKSCAPACLRGKTVAMPGGLTTSAAAPLAAWLALGHLNLSDVHILSVPVISNVPIAVTQNVAQAAWIDPPFQKPLLANGSIKLSQLAAPGDLLTCFVVGPAGISHPQAVEAFLRAVARTEEDYLRPGFLHRRGMVQAMEQVLGESASTVETTTEPIFDPTLSVSGYGPKVIVQQKTWISVGGLLNYTTPLPASRVVDSKFLSAALAAK
jgi:ABC-type nitrate/sulfonate/bicarbonate transport system substrate-binding protein